MSDVTKALWGDIKELEGTHGHWALTHEGSRVDAMDLAALRPPFVFENRDRAFVVHSVGGEYDSILAGHGVADHELHALSG